MRRTKDDFGLLRELCRRIRRGLLSELTNGFRRFHLGSFYLASRSERAMKLIAG